MASMIRTMTRQFKREGKEIRIINGKPQWVKFRPTDAEQRKERHTKLLAQKEVPHNLYSISGNFAK